jgi:hypothetical protein
MRWPGKHQPSSSTRRAASAINSSVTRPGAVVVPAADQYKDTFKDVPIEANTLG